jgi:hypothetical protein
LIILTGGYFRVGEQVGSAVSQLEQVENFFAFENHHEWAFTVTVIVNFTLIVGFVARLSRIAGGNTGLAQSARTLLGAIAEGTIIALGVAGA